LDVFSHLYFGGVWRTEDLTDHISQPTYLQIR
jgi:hypothetical protein